MINIYTAIKTTGRNPWKHGITEVALLVEDHNETIDYTFTKVNPGDVEFDKKALEINKESIETIQTQMPADVVNVMLKNFLNKHVRSNEKFMLISYNAQFVFDFLTRFIKAKEDLPFGNDSKGFLDYFYNPPLDVMQVANMMLQEIRPNIPDFKLDTICKAFEIQEFPQNTCLNKAKQIYCLYHKLIES